ncbi:MAG TPA: YgiQ family radical SAM protein [Marinilabiliales bacterium]|nr:MAG: YgiQ family radical SAM protein [Bacteroidetes bacterium GWC2_40_13]OFX71326.1 MAG: YgiQ family radical SAM protein [Bacteroidetes bacterium GWD2_40_43]OFX91479.1 MAG: YgiQ family radical SAM protein [Bacteroidetes bacterium GWE2_40_63]OFY19548.1 MAG: YgiQ family radical SAM protein [Bacteroidetes bacterium GWF2_40_13]OFZ32187.1 MAG: YgiQ family radical SAM protein [Bacteroidetes bacterium RIFOXYC2_FULL_40_12]HAM97645.1 YgiQ family radical SAM protein [Marinilabiliales bacterium]
MEKLNLLHKKYNLVDWLPTTVKEARERGWDELDVVLFSGDAYVDHPSFGPAVISRVMENLGLKVAIVPQPNWRDDLRDFKKFGRPQLFFGVTSGCMDSMVNHYTANKRLRSDDAYTPGGKAGFRPDYATTVYSQILKKLYPDVPILIGGIEASLRRLTHYDYWSDQLLPSILLNSKADLLVYGLGEKPLKEIVELMQKGVPMSKIQTTSQTAFLVPKGTEPPTRKSWKTQTLAPYEECLVEKEKHAYNFKIIEEESNKYESDRLMQDAGEFTVVVNPSNPPLSEKEMDAVYDLPFTRLPHPKYHDKPVIPAYEMIRHSINSHRGCFGGCSFCTISAHQGKFVSSRSKESILKEVEQVAAMPDFKGYISDVGGPSANMWKMKGKIENVCRSCKRSSCLFPKICPNLDTDHTQMTGLYREIRKNPKIKKAFVGSGIRYDYLDHQEEERSHFKEYLTEMVTHHVSGRLKIAPEHTSPKVLKLMRKPGFELFQKLKDNFDQINQESGLNQQLIPYFISSHPLCEEEDMADVAIRTKNMDFKLEQVQDFTPTPMTLATVIYYSGLDPYTGQRMFTAKSQDEKQNQKQFFFWYKPEESKKLKQRLTQINRPDLILELFGKTNANTKPQAGTHPKEDSKFKHKPTYRKK